MKKINNKGFSLVELIIVIAIMAILVGVLAPQFVKYVEQSRRGKDVQNAANLQVAYLADVADQTITADLTHALVSANLPSTVSAVPLVAGRVCTAGVYYVTLNVTNGTCDVFAADGTTPSVYYELTTEVGAQAYKDH